MLTIDLVHTSETKEAYRFIEDIYEAAYGIRTFTNQPDCLVAARETSGKITGTVGMCSGGEGWLDTEKLLGCDMRRFLPEGYSCSRSNICEFQRFAAQPGSGGNLVSTAVLVGMIRHAYSMGLRYALAVVKPKNREFLKRRLKFPIIEIKHPLDLTGLPREYHGFFMEGDTPVPIVLVINESMMDAIDSICQGKHFLENVVVDIGSQIPPNKPLLTTLHKSAL